MKRKVYLVVALVVFGLCITSHAKAQQSNQKHNVVAASSIPIHDFPANAINSLRKIHILSPAPPLTDLYIQNICTDAIGSNCEFISRNQYRTADVYSGINVYAFYWEIGYGGNPIIKLGSAVLPETSIVSSDGVCIHGDRYTIDCIPGDTIVGFRYVVDVGYYMNQGDSNNLYIQNTSEVYPFNTYSANLVIQYNW